jgi:YD repeat-containing protein
VTAIVRPDESAIRFTYDANGNTTVITTPAGIDHGFGYNRVNLNSAYEAPLGGTTSYRYDRDRRLREVRHPSGKSIEIGYEGGRPASLVTPEAVVGYQYTCDRQLAAASSAGERVSYGYDGPLPTSETFSGTLDQQIGMAYNADLLPSRLTYAGESVDFGYDAGGLLTRAGPFEIFRNADIGLPEAVTGGPLTLARTFNGYGEPVGESFTVNGSTLHSWTVARSDAGRIVARTDSVSGLTAELTYRYDAAGRLTAVARDGVTVEEYRGFRGVG